MKTRGWWLWKQEFYEFFSARDETPGEWRYVHKESASRWFSQHFPRLYGFCSGPREWFYFQAQRLINYLEERSRR